MADHAGTGDRIGPGVRTECMVSAASDTTHNRAYVAPVTVFSEASRSP